MMAAAEWWCWPLPAWLGSGAAWFVLLNVVVGAIFALSSRAQSPSPRRGGGSGITRRASSVLLQRLRSFSVFSSPSPGFHTEAAPAEDSHATFRGTEEAGTTARAWSPSTPRAPTASAPAKREEDVDSLTMDDVYALVQARRQQPPPTLTEEEAAGSEVDAKAEEFIRGFKDDLRQQRLDSIFNYTQMLKQRGAAGRGATPVAEPATADQ
ncbi:hypothetical protein QYE76_004774 [Lolium multiflorum]|uniref:DUF4408 domain-containing protein n=1 Tax=Lolium multiflorum TaxID=4521 RepID=A0AAD8RSQ8_LOLMU|nr:hypothetical protein QYE76_004774 [Lolium multiflorum]